MSPSSIFRTAAMAATATIALTVLAACSPATSPAAGTGGGTTHRPGGAGAGLGQAPAPTQTPAPTSAPADGGTSASPNAGLTGTPIVLTDKASLSGYDVAIDASGRAYLGWISDVNSAGRKIHLCTLPPGATQCAGGIQTVSSPAGGDSSAQGLQVFVTPAGKVTLVWMHDTAASESGPQGSEITTATSKRGGPLSKPADVATAPSFGTMLDAAAGPNNTIWVVTEHSSAGSVQVREGLKGTAVNLHTPYGVGGARLRFSNGAGVLVIQKAGAITSPVAAGSFRHGTFSGFSLVAKTWTAAAELGLTATTSGVRMITSTDDASYHPVNWSWSAAGFSQPTLTGDLGDCSPSSHDLVSDASGRAADVSMECPDVAIANLPDTRHAFVTRFPVNGTFAGGPPQLATTPRGKGWVLWSIESSAGDKLLAAPILLPGGTVTAAKTAQGNQLTLTGPASCLPAVDLTVGVQGKPASQWQVAGTTLTLGGTALPSATLHGATLTPGQTYTLTGTVHFTGPGTPLTLTDTISFESCPN